MKKTAVFVLAGVAAAGMVTYGASAAGGSVPAQQLNGKKQVIVKPIKSNNIEEIQKKLGELGIKGVVIGSNCKPGQTPSLPEQNKPGQNKPEQNKPEQNKPDQNKPGQNKPEQEKPDQNKPEQDNPGNNGSTNSSYEQQVIDLVNKERAKAGLSALKLDKNVAKAALVRAKETEKSFSHTRPNGSKFSTALTESGVSFRGAGENIAWGQKTPQEVMKGWMNSDGHRANILNKNFTTIGVGYYKNAYGVNYWTQLFTY